VALTELQIKGLRDAIEFHQPAFTADNIAKIRSRITNAATHSDRIFWSDVLALVAPEEALDGDVIKHPDAVSIVRISFAAPREATNTKLASKT